MLLTYLRAGYPGLAILTPEEARAEAAIADACQRLPCQLHVWSSSSGLLHPATRKRTPCADPIDAMDEIRKLFTAQPETQTPDQTNTPEPDTTTTAPRHLVILRDFRLHLDPPDPLLIRRLRDLLRAAKSRGHAIILLGPRLDLPPELAHEITHIDFPLPDTTLLGHVLDGILASARIDPPDPATRDESLLAARGLTTTEAENAFALSVVEANTIRPAIVAREKARALKQGGLLEVIETRTSPGNIGGLALLKHWLTRRAGAFAPAARDYGLPAPKGLLMVGLPGTGKSLTAKASADAFGLPLLRLDMGRVFGGLVGQSEANLRAIIRTAEAIAPAVLWIDEIEKAFSGNGSSLDGGTSSRVFGSFLSWMQEKQSPVFVVATANDVSALPPEFLRKGRFDEIFFLDLPGQDERRHIWEIVIARHRRDPSALDPAALARATPGFTGAEIESAFLDALHEAFAETREPTTADLRAAIARTVPLSRLMEEKITALRQWAKGRARPASQTPETPPSKPRTRPKPPRVLSPGRN